LLTYLSPLSHLFFVCFYQLSGAFKRDLGFASTGAI
jgi:hypothetical protein